MGTVSCLAVIHKFDYVFAENGTVQFKEGKLISKQVRGNNNIDVCLLTTKQSLTLILRRQTLTALGL